MTELIKAAPEQSRIILVIKGRVFRDCIEGLLEAPDRTIVGSVDKLDQFEAAVEPLPHAPNLVIALIGEQTEKEFDRILSLRLKLSTTRWILLGRRWTPEATRKALEIGVEALLLEDSGSDVLKLVVELVSLGQSFVPLELAMLESAGDSEGQTVPQSEDSGHNIAFSENSSNQAVSAIEPIADPDHEVIIRFPRDVGKAVTTAERGSGGRLSEREEQILGCLALGYSNKVIARNLDIAEATVKVHVKALLRKMQVSNRTQAAISAPKFLSFPAQANRVPMASGTCHTIPGVALPRRSA